MNYYEKIKDLKHIFIYGVCGRCSSTAMQRILNSSNEVCIFGESWGINSLLLNIIQKIEKKTNTKWRNIKEKDLNTLKKCFKNNQHKEFYANALNNPDETILSLKNIFSRLYKPVILLKRFGFKEVGINNSEELNYLKKMFNNCYIIFVFKDPFKQYKSLRITRYFYYSKNLRLFLKEYERISNEYIKFAEKYKNPYFIEDIKLRDMNCVKKLIKFLDLSKFDKSLIDTNIGSSPQKLSLRRKIRLWLDLWNRKKKIRNSNAYKNYLKMKKLSDQFFKTL